MSGFRVIKNQNVYPWRKIRQRSHKCHSFQYWKMSSFYSYKYLILYYINSKKYEWDTEQENRPFSQQLRCCKGFIHVLEDNIDFLFRSKICKIGPRASAHHTCFSTPAWRFAALFYRRPENIKIKCTFNGNNLREESILLKAT